MKQIRIEGNRIVVSFNNMFYSRESIIKSIEEFKGVCEIELNENKAILFTKNEKIALEFANYVLSIGR